MKYAPYEKLNIELENPINKKCIYKERIVEQPYSKKCRNKDTSEYMKQKKEEYNMVKDNMEQNKKNKDNKKKKINKNKKNKTNKDNKEDIYKVHEPKSDIDYIIDESTLDDCQKHMYSNRIETNIVSNKNNKQLNTRVIKTIPYRNKSNFEYNPELEIIINSGLQTNNRKSVSNTSEIKEELPPMIDFVKNKLDDKNSNFDISRFQLSSRQIKGNKVYVNNYKKKLKLIKSSLNNN